MPFDLSTYSRLRPYLYHLTAAENLPRIRRTRVLESAAMLAHRAGRPDLLGTRRRNHVHVVVDDETVIIRDQAPLHAGNMRLDENWTYERFVRHLNDRVFFWPGGIGGPISYGLRHFGRYESESPVIVRASFASLIAANPDADPLFCKSNSGSPRWSRGIPGDRGDKTFVPVTDAPFRAAQTVEVTFEDEVRLPDDVEWGKIPGGPWTPLE